jgi:drug/metabolite transporter (DMT)-like permease
VKSPPLAAIPQDVRGPTLACFRVLAAAVVLAAFVRPAHVRWRPMLVPLVLSFASMNLLFITAMTRTTAAAAIFLQYTSTVWTVLFGIFFLREHANRGNLIALGCAIAGMAWIVSADWATRYFLGNCLALASGVCYAGVVISLKQLQAEHSAWLVALCHAAGGLVLLPIVFIKPPLSICCNGA